MKLRTSRRELDLSAPRLMGILNVTPDSFSDGGKVASVDDALRIVERMIADGAHIVDIGGESTRPDSARVAADEESRRVVAVIDAVTRRFDVPVSIDTSKAVVARRALDAGAEIVNDVSGLLFDPEVAEVSAQAGAGLVLMHLRGTFETMHTQPPVDDIVSEVARGFRESLATALNRGVEAESIVLDVGLGFSKTFEQNLELIAKLGKLVAEFPGFPMLVGASRKSFIGRVLGGVPTDERLAGSVSAAALAAWNGARILRVHDVRETADALKVVGAIRETL